MNDRERVSGCGSGKVEDSTKRELVEHLDVHFLRS